MQRNADKRIKGVYVDSLRWRHKDLLGEIEAIGRQIAAYTRHDAELRQRLQAVELLLSAEGEPPAESRDTIAPLEVSSDPSTGKNGHEPDSNPLSHSFARWGPRSRDIYTATAEVIREAGVPLHYRVLAEEVQKHVALGGVDPGATLIAHLHRAQDVFPRVGRGIYGLQGMVAVAQPDQPITAAPTTRRRKTRRRAR